MFSRVAASSRAMGRGMVRATRRGFNSSTGANGARRFASYATMAAFGTVTIGLAANELMREQVVMCDSKDLNNTAFVFIKPHAVTENTKAMVKAGLEAQGVKVLKEGVLTAEEIDKGMLIDQHYYAIASKATLLKPNQLNVPAEKFQKKFGLGWKEALDKGVVFNALDACAKLNMTAEELNTEWAKAKKAGKLIKFGGGFYCGLIDTIPNQSPMYVFNGFFMNMRQDFVAPGAKIHYYVVEFAPSKLSWEDFRGKVLGPTDPAEAPADSLRGQILANWKVLGLPSQPNVGQNGVHASASPFEALAERMNWLGESVTDDSFGKALIAAGVPASTIKTWSVDPVVSYGSPEYPVTMSLFDSLEDTDSNMCLARAMMINGNNGVNPVHVGGAFAAGALAGAAAAKTIS